MRLIDADVLKIKINEEWFIDDYGQGLHLIGEKDVDETPTVKAIPIEWIKNWYRRALDNGGFMGDETISVGDLLADWEKENEVN